MKKILFPTDYSSAARHAFIYALGVARHLKSEIIVFHAYQIPRIRGGANLPRTMEETYASMRAEEKEKFDKHCTALRNLADKKGFDDVQLINLAQEGGSIASIVGTAKKMETDLIVMGTTGASGFKEVFLGSIAGEVMERADCPVLAVPEKAEFNGSIHQIAVTTTFKEEEKMALWKTLDFAKYFNANVICLHVNLEQAEFVNYHVAMLQKEFEHETSLSFRVVDGNNLEKALAHFLDEHDIDILAMLTHKRSVVEELFNYSRTKKMVYHSKTPILAIQA